MVVCMIAANFKPLIISVLDSAFSNVANIPHSHDFVSYTVRSESRCALRIRYSPVDM